jgi:hypothetical protein
MGNSTMGNSNTTPPFVDDLTGVSHPTVCCAGGPWDGLALPFKQFLPGERVWVVNTPTKGSLDFSISASSRAPALTAPQWSPGYYALNAAKTEWQWNPELVLPADLIS